jgi:hypothetical protein
VYRISRGSETILLFHAQKDAKKMSSARMSSVKDFLTPIY